MSSLAHTEFVVTPAVRGARPKARVVPIALITISVGGLLMLPLFVESTYILHMMVLIFINVIVGSAWPMAMRW